jgi:two-component system chemotaxis response regulator CheB
MDAVPPMSAATGTPLLRVLIVDDSAFMRLTLSRIVNEAPGLAVAGTARDGLEALRLIPELQPDVITLDIEMPHLDGLTTLREIMANSPRPVIMLSSLTAEGASETIRALTLGAVDFIQKPDSKANIAAIAEDVVTKIRRAAHARVYRLPQPRQASNPAGPGTGKPSVMPAEKTFPLPRAAGSHTHSLTSQDKIVVIGASTGGPRALNLVIPKLPADLPAAVLIIQHMPAGFTRSLAERLDHLSSLPVKEADPGDFLETGRCLLAPGGFHMLVNKAGQISLNQNPAVHGVRPAVDATLASVAQYFGARTIGVILTGMGRDGTNGAMLIHSAGGRVIAEDESTCVVWGMPRCALEAGVTDLVAPIHDIAGAIERLAWNLNSTTSSSAQSNRS